MSGLSIGVGIGLRYNKPIFYGGYGSDYPSYLSCFATGIWEDEGRWFGNDLWSMEPKEYPFIRTGLWNMEGIFRFKDKFSFNANFPNENSISTKSNNDMTKKINKSYWNF